MKEKLVEEWLIRTGERGGIDHAFGQWLIAQRHEILWLGHSSTELGKDIVSIAPDGSLHAFQMKDEDLSLGELRKITGQVSELINLPIVHPRIPAGSRHVPHLITSGLAKEQAIHRIRAQNDKLRAEGKAELELVDRRGLIQRFTAMSDSFWPEKPENIRDFFSFYLADGKGDFDPKRFSAVLCGLLTTSDRSAKRRAQRVAAIGLLGNYLLNPFEREGDHWSLFQGWTMIAAHLAWFASKNRLPNSKWLPSFELAKRAAIEQLVRLSLEGLKERALAPHTWEFDDYTRARNLIIAAALAAVCLLKKAGRIGDLSAINLLLDRLQREDRLFCWGESAVSHILTIQWHLENCGKMGGALPQIHEVVQSLCERNHTHAEDERFAPPQVSPDEILTRLFSHEKQPDQSRRGRGTWTLETLVHFLTRRGNREFLETNWAAISRLEMIHFEPQAPEDILIWQCETGREVQRKPEKTQSWKLLVKEAAIDLSSSLPQILVDHTEFALIFMLAYPHRASRSLVGLLDAAFCRQSGIRKV